jgi:hypothetical protein
MRKRILAGTLAILGGCATAAPAQEPIVGRFLEHAPNAAIRMEEDLKRSFGGWQTSDVTFDSKSNQWWSVGDQNSGEAGIAKPSDSHWGRYLYRLTPGARPQADPIKIMWDRKSPDFEAVHASFGRSNLKLIDFEGLAADPTRAGAFFACTEGEEPWLIELVHRPDEMKIAAVRSVRISREDNHDRDKNGVAVAENTAKERDVAWNARWEGIAVSPDGKTIYLGTEWARSPSRIYTVSVADFRKGEWSSTGEPPRVYPQPLEFAGIDGGVYGLTIAPYAGKSWLIALDRNNSELRFFDLANLKASPRIVKLDLRAPALDGRAGGVELESASPEGIAVDSTGRVLLISDPAPEFYVAKRSGVADDAKLKNLIPLVFETTLADLLR